MLTQPFIQRLAIHCKKSPGHVILAEGNDARTVKAADILLRNGLCAKVTLLGDMDQMQPHLNLHEQLKANASLVIIDRNDVALQQTTAICIKEVLSAKNKPVDISQVERASRDPLYQAGALLRKGYADCTIAGAVATTADVIRAAINTIGLASGVKTASGGFFMDRSNQGKLETYYYADAGVVVEPTLEQLVDIASSSCETWQKIMDTPPVVAFLSFSTKGSATHPAAEKMAKANQLFQLRFPTIASDGEMQFDAAFVETVGLKKAPQSLIPGKANIFIFPDLNSGNIAYKITQRLGGFGAYGPILQGLARPYSDLSRGASAEDIVASVLINRLRAL